MFLQILLKMYLSRNQKDLYNNSTFSEPHALYKIHVYNLSYKTFYDSVVE